MASYAWLHLVDGALLMLLLWQQIVVSESGCVSDVCFCFADGDVECADIYLRRVPRFKRSEDNATMTYEHIDLSKNRFERVSNRSFRNLRVRSLKIWDNRRPMKIDGRALRPLRDVLKVVSMRGNKIPELPSGLFRKQRQLTEIHLPQNDISVLHRGAFRGASAVEIVNLERNHLKRLEENVFAGLVNLTKLFLARNQLTLIDPKAFRTLGQLDTLILKANMLRDLQPRGFGHLASLRNLDISKNKLPALFPQMFSGLRSLESLILSRNPITFISPSAFSEMSSLRNLSLNKAKLAHVQPGSFEGLASLRSLTLNDNVIRELPDRLFAGLRSLRKLQAQRNKLTTVNACSFDDAHAVEQIWLTGNPIHCDCAVAWTSPAVANRSTPAVRVYGQCASPAIVRGEDLSEGRKYHVCRHLGTEHCGELPNDTVGGRTATDRYNDVIQYLLLRHV